MASPARRWMRRYLEHRSDDAALFDDDRAWSSPAVTGAFGQAERKAFRRLWDERWWFVEVLESLPQTIVHHDLWPLNVLAADDGTSVVLDLAVLGEGAFGQDVSNFILDFFLDLLADESRLDELEAAVVAAYLDVVPDPETALLAIHASAAKFCWLPLRMVAPHVVGFTGYQPDGATDEEVFRRRAPILIRMLEWAEDARTRYRSR